MYMKLGPDSRIFQLDSFRNLFQVQLIGILDVIVENIESVLVDNESWLISTT